MLIAQVILVINGLYDIMCALGLLSNWGVLEYLHLSLFCRHQDISNSMFKRFLGYWIFTYGTTRLVCGLNGYTHLASLSYIIEALCFEYEAFTNTNTNAHRIHIVSCICLLSAVLIHYT